MYEYRQIYIRCIELHTYHSLLHIPFENQYTPQATAMQAQPFVAASS